MKTIPIVDGERLAYTPNEVAAKVGVSRSHVYRAIGSGRLRAVKLGDGSRLLIRVLPEAVRAWLESAPPVR